MKSLNTQSESLDCPKFFKDCVNFFNQNSIKAYYPKHPTIPESIVDETIDFRELFEHFNTEEFNELFWCVPLKIQKVMAMCHIFFMSNFVWNSKIYLSTPNIRTQIMPLVLGFLGFKESDYTELFGRPVCSSQTLKTPKFEYTGKYTNIWYKPHAIQIEENIQTPNGITAFANNKNCSIVALDEPWEYFRYLYFRPKSRFLINDFVWLIDYNSPVEKLYGAKIPFKINESKLGSFKNAFG